MQRRPQGSNLYRARRLRAASLNLQYTFESESHLWGPALTTRKGGSLSLELLSQAPLRFSWQRAQVSNRYGHYGGDWGAAMFRLENKDRLYELENVSLRWAFCKGRSIPK
jgi:hypothetical protein